MKYKYSMERQIHFATNWRSSTSLMFGRVGWIEDERFAVVGAVNATLPESKPQQIEVNHHHSGECHPFRLPRPKLPVQKF